MTDLNTFKLNQIYISPLKGQLHELTRFGTAAVATDGWCVQQVLLQALNAALGNAVVQRIREDHRGVYAIGARVWEEATVGLAASNRTEAALAGRLLWALLLLVLGLGHRVLLPRRLVGRQLFRHHFLQLGSGREATPHTVLDDDGLNKRLIILVADETLVDHITSQELRDQLQLVGGRKDTRNARPAARGARRSRQKLKLLPDVLAGRWRLQAVVLLLVEVLIFIEVEKRLDSVIVQVVVPALEVRV